MNLFFSIRQLVKVIFFLILGSTSIELIHGNTTVPIDYYNPSAGDPLNQEMMELQNSMRPGTISGGANYGSQPQMYATGNGYPVQSMQPQYTQQSTYGSPTLVGYQNPQYPQTGVIPVAQYNQQPSQYQGMQPVYAPNMAARPQIQYPSMQGGALQQPAGANISPNLGAMAVEQAAQIFDDVTNGTSLLDTPENFNATLQSVEKAFNQCNFAQTAATTEITTSALATKAIAAIKKIRSRIDTTWISMQRKLATNVLAVTQDAEEQDKWIATGYMLAAAANNKSFRAAIASHTLTASSNFFWNTHWRVFSVQPVSLRIQNSAGIFKESPIEKAFIEKLFTVETLLSSAHATNVTLKEEGSFVQGVRLLTSVIIQPNFINGSIGLQEFALWLFQNGVVKWLKNLSPTTIRHEELWIVAAEAFNIMYSAAIGPNITPPPNISASGVNRANPLPSDHLMCDFGKGYFCKALQKTNLAQFSADIKKLSDLFTTHKVNEGQAGLLAKNDSELQLLMMYAEASEYLMQETTAAESANFITYHFESGFRFNNKMINWAEVSTSMGSLSGIILDRLYEKTGTSILGVESLAFKGGYKGRNGLYATTAIYQSLAQGFATLIDISTKNLAVGQKISSIMRELKENNTKLKKYMMDRTDLKTWRSRLPRYAPVGNFVQQTQFNPSGLPQMGPVQYPNTMRQQPATFRAPTGMQTGYPQQQMQRPAQYGQQYPVRTY